MATRCYSKGDQLKTCMITANGESVCGYEGDGTSIILGKATPVKGSATVTEHFDNGIDFLGMINKAFSAPKKESFDNYQPTNMNNMRGTGYEGYEGYEGFKVGQESQVEPSGGFGSFAPVNFTQ